jgi:hypothetical protein
MLVFDDDDDGRGQILDFELLFEERHSVSGIYYWIKSQITSRSFSKFYGIAVSFVLGNEKRFMSSQWR